MQIANDKTQRLLDNHDIPLAAQDIILETILSIGTSNPLNLFTQIVYSFCKLGSCLRTLFL